MKNKVYKIVISLLLAGILVAGTSALAESIKNRMKKRLPAIVALKDKGIVGESNRGYLQVPGSANQKEDIVNVT